MQDEEQKQTQEEEIKGAVEEQANDASINEDEKPKKARKRNLSPRQAAFVREYLKTGEAVQAARNAGYEEKSAKNMPWKHTRVPAIMDKLNEEQKRLRDEAEIDIQKMVRKLYNCVVVDDMEVFNYDPYADPGEQITLKDLNELPDHVRQTVRITAESRRGKLEFKIEKADPMQAFDKLAKILGLSPETININFGGEAKQVIHTVSGDESNQEAIRKFNEFIEGFNKLPKKD